MFDIIEIFITKVSPSYFLKKPESAERSEKRKNVSSLVRSKEAIKVNANSRASVQRSSFMNFREYFKSEFTRTTKEREREKRG